MDPFENFDIFDFLVLSSSLLPGDFGEAFPFFRMHVYCYIIKYVNIYIYDNIDIMRILCAFAAGRPHGKNASKRQLRSLMGLFFSVPLSGHIWA